MPQGIAVLVGPASENMFREGYLYRIYPSLANTDDVDNHVVVARTRNASDHGYAETTVFLTDSSGSTHGMLDRGAEALLRHRRIIGRIDVPAALANLGNGYFEVSPQELPSLRQQAHQAAVAFGEQRLAMRNQGALDYADDNWGLFAAMQLDSDPNRPALTQTTNSVDWAALDTEEEERLCDPAWSPF